MYLRRKRFLFQKISNDKENFLFNEPSQGRNKRECGWKFRARKTLFDIDQKKEGGGYYLHKYHKQVRNKQNLFSLL